MNLLFATGAFPYPPHDGERLRSYHLLRSLAPHCKIDLLTFFDSERELVEGQPELKRWCRSVNAVPRPVVSRWQLGAIALKGLPLFVARNASVTYASKLRELIANQNYDLVHLDGLPIGQYRDCIPARVPVVRDIRDAWTILYGRRLTRSYSAESWKQWARYLAVKQYEGLAVRSGDAVVMLSKDDREALKRIWPEAARITLIPNGVDTEFFAPRSKSITPGLIVFSGAMGYGPNAEAAAFFIKNVMPLIQRSQPDVRFRVVGRDPGPDLLALAGERVEFTGYVSDVRDHIAEAQVVVCPLLNGAGIKNKVLEAMAMQKAIVATRVAVEGIDAPAGSAYILADDAEAFADEVARLLESPAHCVELASNARAFVQRRFSWAASASSLMELYASLAARSTGPCES